jgi:predicted methyltransferase
MRQILIGSLLCLVVGGSAVASNHGLPARPDEDVARDDGRKPFKVLEFLGVKPGMVALDVIAAGGYYTEALANVVGEEGLVYAQNPARVLRFRGGANDRALTERLFGDRLPNVRRLDREFDDLGLVAESVDVAITALNFHDVYNTDPQAAQGMLQVIKGILKPGGVLGIIDHVGNPEADNANQHRIDPELVIAAAKAAGFKVKRSKLLANRKDDHTQNPFAPDLRGQTDRFVLKLTKLE